MPTGNLFEEVKEAYDIVEVVSNYVKLKKVGRNYVGLCPFHSEKTPSFVVSPEKQIFKCFGCGVAGDVITFYMKIKGISFKEALYELAEQAGIKVEFEYKKEKKDHGDLIELNYKVAKFYHHLLGVHTESKEAREYLRKRGLSEDTVKEFLIGFAPSEGRVLASFLRAEEKGIILAEQAGLVKKSADGSYVDLFRGRIVFPVFNLKGECVGFGGRTLDPDVEPKYLNTPETKVYRKSELLYGLYQAKDFIKKEKRGFLVEGYFDFLSLWDKGIKNVVATCGTALTEKHVKVLKKFCEEWIIFYDGDSAGKKATARAISLFVKEGIVPRCVCLPEGEDPDSWINSRNLNGESLSAEVLKITKDAISFVLDYYREEHGGYTSRAFKDIVEVFREVEDPILRKKIAEEVGFALEIPEGEVLKYLTKGRRVLEPKIEEQNYQEEEDSAFKMIAEYLVNYPEAYKELREAGLKELLEKCGFSGKYTKFLKRLVDLLEEGNSEFDFVPEPEFQEVLGEIYLSPPFEDSKEVLFQIKEYIRRMYLKQELRRIVESVKALEKNGEKHELEKYLWMLKNSYMCSYFTNKEETK
ncbi:MAG: DNA primase [Thermodesulfobacteria bacterium]|nr:DNA primase [Thermodesulfobacteriota bacterium]